MKHLVNVLIIFTFTSIGVTQNYICTVEAATGFIYETITDKWVTQNFTPNNTYLLSPPKEDETHYGVNLENYAYLFKEIGEYSHLLATCPKDFDERGWLNCGTFRMNSKNSRFIYSYHGGYVTSTGEEITLGDTVLRYTDETSDSPYIEIGICTIF